MEMAAMLMPLLQNSLHWNRARIHFLAQFLVALLKVKTVNLAEIAVAFSGKAKYESNYKRIQRFLNAFAVDFVVIAHFIAMMLPMASSPFMLTMDRTNWKLGKSNINILVLGIVYKGIAFPIFWILLPKRGNSNTKERIDLIDRFIAAFSIGQIQCLLADREFLGEQWFGYLLNNRIHFRIRIRENMFISNARGALTKARGLFRHLEIGQHEILSNRLVNGQVLFVVALRLADGYLILVTDFNPENALQDYAKRWEIEVLFSCLKTRGFRFEETHLTDPKKIQKLVSLLSIAFAIVHVTGEWQNEQKPLVIKKHKRKAKSLFRYGMDFLRKIVLNLNSNLKSFFILVHFFERFFPSCNFADAHKAAVS